MTSRLPRAARTQSLVFCVLAVCTTAASWWLPRLTPGAELALLISLIVLVGVPHGALDPAYVSHSLRGSIRRGWLVFAARYVALSAAVVVVWLVWPLAALGAFLAMSAFHFSGDPIGGASRSIRVLQGSAVIVLPALWHAAETETTLAYLAGDSAAAWCLRVMRPVALPLALALGAAALVELRRGSVLVAVEAGATMMLTITAPPLVGFTMYFCAMHSARHIVRTMDRAGMTWLQLALLASAPMLGAVGTGFVALNFMEQAPANALAIRVVFVGLAALTVPHMAIVERARFGHLSSAWGLHSTRTTLRGRDHPSTTTHRFRSGPIRVATASGRRWHRSAHRWPPAAPDARRTELRPKGRSLEWACPSASERGAVRRRPWQWRP